MIDITAAKQDLLPIATRAAGAANRKATLPLLSCALLTATPEGLLTVTGSDLYVTSRGSAAVEARKGGAVAVAAHSLAARVKEMPDGPVTLKQTARGLEVKSGAIRYVLQTVDPTDYPPLPPPSTLPGVVLPAARLRTLLARAAYAMSADATKVNQHALHLVSYSGELSATSTDGHRLAHASTATSPGAPDWEALLPLPAVEEVTRLVGSAGDEAEVTLTLDGPALHVAVGASSLVARTTAAEYPSWRLLVPTEHAARTRVDRAALLAAFRAASLSASHGTKRCAVDTSATSITISAESSEEGEAAVEVAAEREGKVVKWGVHPVYAREALTALAEHATVVLSTTKPLNPVLITPLADDDVPAFAVLMPMNLEVRL